METDVKQIVETVSSLEKGKLFIKLKWHIDLRLKEKLYGDEA